MDAVIVIGCIVGLLVVAAVVFRPGAPDAENLEEAPQALGEGVAGLFAVMLLAVIAIGAVLAL